MQICYWTFSIPHIQIELQANVDRKLEHMQKPGAAIGSGNKWWMIEIELRFNKPRSDGNSTEFGAGDFISAAIGPRRAVGVHGCCLTPILSAITFNLPLMFRTNQIDMFQIWKEYTKNRTN